MLSLRYQTLTIQRTVARTDFWHFTKNRFAAENFRFSCSYVLKRRTHRETTAETWTSIVAESSLPTDERVKVFLRSREETTIARPAGRPRKSNRDERVPVQLETFSCIGLLGYRFAKFFSSPRYSRSCTSRSKLIAIVTVLRVLRPFPSSDWNNRFFIYLFNYSSYYRFQSRVNLISIAMAYHRSLSTCSILCRRYTVNNYPRVTLPFYLLLIIIVKIFPVTNLCLHSFRSAETNRAESTSLESLCIIPPR